MGKQRKFWAMVLAIILTMGMVTPVMAEGTDFRPDNRPDPGTPGNPWVSTPTTHNITFSSDSNGNITVVNNGGGTVVGGTIYNVPQGATVSLMAQPHGGFVWDSYTIYGTTTYSVSHPWVPSNFNTTIIDINNISEDVTVSVYFRATTTSVFEISLSADYYDFGTVYEGYTVPSGSMIIVNNTGNQPTDTLIIEVEGTNGTADNAFVVMPSSLSNIDVGENQTFAVTPTAGLSVGVHTATVTVSGGNGITASLDVSITVEPEPQVTHTVMFSYGENGGINVTNTGGGFFINLGGLLGGPRSITQVPDGATVILTAQPNSGFVVDTWSVTGANYSLSGAGDIILILTEIENNVTVSVTFEVQPLIPAPVFEISLSVDYLDFGTVYEGYDHIPTHPMVLVLNTGNQPTGVLDVSVIGTNGTANSAFVVDTPIASIGVGDSQQLDVRPSFGLSEGVYTATVTVTGDNDITSSLDVSFTVEQQVDTNIPSGSGTPIDPFLIATPENLEWMANDINVSYLNRHFRVIADITAPNNLIIASASNPFIGVFDGNEYTITVNINIFDNNRMIGLFDTIGANGFIENLTIAGDVAFVASGVSGFNGIGGITGQNFGTIENSRVLADINATGQSSATGGISGRNEATGIINRSYFTGDVHGNVVGGITGSNQGLINNSHSIGNITGGGINAGGIAGSNGSTGIVRNSYTRGSVSGTNDTGGVTGWNSGTVENSYSTGRIRALGLAGGVVGMNSSGIVRNNYAIGEVSSGNSSFRGTSGGIVGASTGSGRIENNVALNSNICNTSDATYGSGVSSRIVNISAGNAINNFAYTNTMINGALFSGDGTNPNGSDGQDVSRNIFSTVEFWRDTMEWDFINVWQWNSAINLPTLRNVGGDQNHYVPEVDISSVPIRPLGEGTPSSPFLISTPENLLWMATNIGYLDRYFLVTNNITAPIDLVIGQVGTGGASNPLRGEFDGDGHTITLNINTPGHSNVGLFARILDSGVVRNLTTAGSVVGYNVVGGISGTNDGTIANSGSTALVRGNRSAGGLVGSNTGSVVSSYSTGNIYVSTIIAGGLIGGNSGTIEASFASGTVESSGNAGGLIGHNTTGNVIKSFATGNVVSTGVSGGLVGQNSGRIENSYATGDISGASAGGVAGGNASNAGQGIIINTYSIGAVSAVGTAGGISGGSQMFVVVENSIALNPNISGGVGVVSRITPPNTGANFINNHASTIMTLNNVLFTGVGTLNDRHGQNVIPSAFSTIEFWQDELDWDFVNIWEWNPTTQLPILRNIGGNQSHFAPSIAGFGFNLDILIDTTTPSALTISPGAIYLSTTSSPLYPINDQPYNTLPTQSHATEPRRQPPQQPTHRHERNPSHEWPIWPEPAPITDFTETYWSIAMESSPVETIATIDTTQPLPSFTTTTIIDFAPLISNIIVQAMTDELYLPDTLIATVHFPAEQAVSWFDISTPAREMTLPVSVIWEMSPTNQAGVYLFTARILDNMAVAVELPTITVRL